MPAIGMTDRFVMVFVLGSRTTALVHSATPPPLNPSFGPYRTDPKLDLGVMPTHDVLLVGLRGGRPRIRQLGERRLSL